MTAILSGNSSTDQTAVNPTTVLSPETIEAFNQDPQIKALVGWIHDQYEKAKSERQRFERQWAINLSFYYGKQNIQYMPAARGSIAAGKLVTPAAPSWASRRVTNRIRPIIRTELARLTSNKPNASVVPASSEDMDLFAAQAGEQIWESIYNGKKLHKTFSRSIFWMAICGTSFTKCWWDPNAYDDLTKDQGSIQYGVVSPYHLYVPDLLEEEIEEQPYIFNVYAKTPEWVKSVYGISVEASVTSANNPFENALFALGTNKAKPDSVLVIEAWFKPNSHPLFPVGGMVTLVDTKVVAISIDGIFYNHKQYPFVKWDHIPTGTFYSESVITDLLDPQREYNRTKNQIIESKNRMAKPQLIAPKGSVDPSKITSEPGIVIEYRPGLTPPQPLPLQSIPPYVLQFLDREVMDMEDISSQHQISRGSAPPGVTAATAISFMQERDDSLMTSAYQSIEHGWEKLAKQTLSHVVQFWDVARSVSVTGLDGSFDSIVLKGTELESGTDIRIEAGSALPVSKAAKQAFLLDMMKMGFIDPNKGLELLDMGGLDQLYSELKVDERQAQRENLRMSKLEINTILEYEQKAQSLNDQAQQQQDVMSQPAMMDPTLMSDPSMTGPAAVDPNMSPDMGMNAAPQQDAQAMGPAGNDLNSGAPLQVPMNLVPVNTWDNHQLHIDVHNRYRKTQAFELLSDEVRAQFEYHVAMHAMALNQAASAAAMLPPPPEGSQGAQNGSGTPVGQQDPLGSNQFGPPGTENGAPPPDMMGQQNG